MKNIKNAGVHTKPIIVKLFLLLSEIRLTSSSLAWSTGGQVGWLAGWLVCQDRKEIQTMCNDLAFSFDLLGNDCWLPFTTRFMPVLLLFPFQGTMAVRCGVWVLTYIRTYIRCWTAFIAM